MARAAARGAWPVQLAALGARPGSGHYGTPEARVAMVWPLTLEAWALSGRSIPVYAREATPLRLCRLDRRRPETPV
jgi:hypothetical protein